MTKNERERFARNVEKIDAANSDLQRAVALLTSALPSSHPLHAALDTIRTKSRKMRDLATWDAEPPKIEHRPLMAPKNGERRYNVVNLDSMRVTREVVAA